jgi:hypothetical protein
LRNLLVLALPITLFSASLGCDEYHLYQYHGDEEDPWQDFYPFLNICTDTLCHPVEGDCVGTIDHFTLHTEPAAGYDRFVFFEGCESCTGDNEVFERGEGFRTGGSYAYFEGVGDIGIYPTGLIPRTGHVRRYPRGGCALSLDLMDIPDEGEEPLTITDFFADEIKWGFWKTGGMYEPDIELASSRVYLGTESCEDVLLGSNRDYYEGHFNYYLRMGENGWGYGCCGSRRRSHDVHRFPIAPTLSSSTSLEDATRWDIASTGRTTFTACSCIRGRSSS